jgi:queuosine precursor transporter
LWRKGESMTDTATSGLAADVPAGVQAVEAGAIRGARLRYYDYCMAAFAVILICSNLIGAGKVATLDLPILGAVTFGAGILFFPLSYVLGDILTEVYGYARARRVVWVGFVASVFAAGMAAVVVAMPPAADWQGQDALAAVMGQAPRIFAASILAFWAGEFANAFVLARMKVLTRGRWGIWETSLILTVMLTNYLLKVGWEALLTPVTYKVVGAMKAAEGLDVYDVETDFTPFRTKV